MVGLEKDEPISNIEREPHNNMIYTLDDDLKQDMNFLFGSNHMAEFLEENGFLDKELNSEDI